MAFLALANKKRETFPISKVKFELPFPSDIDLSIMQLVWRGPIRKTGHQITCMYSSTNTTCLQRTLCPPPTQLCLRNKHTHSNFFSHKVNRTLRIRTTTFCALLSAISSSSIRRHLRFLSSKIISTSASLFLITFTSPFICCWMRPITGSSHNDRLFEKTRKCFLLTMTLFFVERTADRFFGDNIKSCLASSHAGCILHKCLP